MAVKRKRKLIPYAGFDEDDWHFAREVPVEHAEELRSKGMSWKEIANELTIEYNRDPPFTLSGVYNAVARLKKEQANEQRDARSGDVGHIAGSGNP
jgi:hypothetical protein